MHRHICQRYRWPPRLFDELRANCGTDLKPVSIETPLSGKSAFGVWGEAQQQRDAQRKWGGEGGPDAILDRCVLHVCGITRRIAFQYMVDDFIFFGGDLDLFHFTFWGRFCVNKCVIRGV